MNISAIVKRIRILEKCEQTICTKFEIFLIDMKHCTFLETLEDLHILSLIFVKAYDGEGEFQDDSQISP